MTVKEEMELIIAQEIKTFKIQNESKKELYQWLRFGGFSQDGAFSIINYKD